jgi:hypothetical protein
MLHNTNNIHHLFFSLHHLFNCFLRKFLVKASHSKELVRAVKGVLSITDVFLIVSSASEITSPEGDIIISVREHIIVLGWPSLFFSS